MKKTIKYLFATALVLAVASCTQKNEPQVNPTSEEGNTVGGTLITCTFDSNGETRTTIDGNNATLWSDSDNVVIYDVNDTTKKATLVLGRTESPIKDGKGSFTFQKPTGWSNNIGAIYPASAFVEFDKNNNNNPKITFSGQDGTFAKANICVAKTDTTTMSFKNVGAILKFPSKPADITNIIVAIDSLTKKFTVSFSNETPSLTAGDSAYSKEFNIGTGTSEVYIGVPAGSIVSNDTCFVIYRNASKSIQGTYCTGNHTIARNTLYTMPDITANGILPGVFTVGAASGDYTGKVRFSRGNLYCKRSSATSDDWTWNFYESQYQFNSLNNASDVRASGQRTATTDDTEIDLFYEGYDATYSLNPTDKQSRSIFADWGTTIDNEGTWRTLSFQEWAYSLNIDGSVTCRQDANRFAKARINDVKGLIIFPDGYNNGTAISGVTGVAEVNNKQAAFPTDNVTDWTTMETAGCVFLPTAGFRDGQTIYFNSFNTGRYCCSLLKTKFLITNTALELVLNDDYASSVRLVCDVE